MADDFGDDAGRQIFDWALRLGMEGYRRGGGAAGQRAVEDAIGRLEAALENARDAIGAKPGPSGGAPQAARTDARFARLDMSEFAALEDGQPLQTPPEIRVLREVTGDPAYKNRALARTQEL